MSPKGYKYPVCSWITRSRLPGISLAMTGLPNAMASRIVLLCPSYNEPFHKTSQVEINAKASSRWPTNRTESAAEIESRNR